MTPIFVKFVFTKFPNSTKFVITSYFFIYTILCVYTMKIIYLKDLVVNFQRKSLIKSCAHIKKKTANP